MNNHLIHLAAFVFMLLTGSSTLYAQMTQPSSAANQTELKGESHADEQATEQHPPEENSSSDHSEVNAADLSKDSELFGRPSVQSMRDENSSQDKTNEPAQNQKTPSESSAADSKPVGTQAVKPSESVLKSANPADASKSPAVKKTRQATARSGDESSAQILDELPDDPDKSAAAGKPLNVVPSHQPWSYYKPLIERNIFTRTTPRSTAIKDKPQTTEQPVATKPSEPQASWVLTGIVIHEQGNYAFFENSLTNVTLRISAGQTLGQSRVSSIDSDHVLIAAQGENQQDGQRQDQRVSIGSTIDGSSATLGTPSSGSVFGDSTPATSSSQNGSSSSSSTPQLNDEAKMSVIERMRARRLQESGK